MHYVQEFKTSGMQPALLFPTIYHFKWVVKFNTYHHISM